MIRFLRFRGEKIAGDAQPSVIQSVIALLYALVNGFIGVYLLFTMHEAILTYVLMSNIHFSSRDFINFSVGIILSILWICFVIIAQHLYERDFMYSWFPKRFIMFVILQFVMIAAANWYIYSFV